MADFNISAIKMDSTGQHIEWVKTHKTGGTGSSVNSRKFVAELISAGKATFQTIFFDPVKNVWIHGAIVKATPAGYITTHPDGTTLDNLGRLPRF
jgi:hypothetical protein